MLSPGLAGAQPRPAEIIASLKRHPAIAPFVAAGTLEESSVHLIPEGGYATISMLAGDLILVAGDAATSTLAVGIYLEGGNLAIGSGHRGRGGRRGDGSQRHVGGEPGPVPP